MTTLAIDLGTSAIKLMRVDANLGILTVDRFPLSGLHVDVWMNAIRENLQTHGDGHGIERIAVTGQMHGLVPLEESGYGEGIPWTDQRGASMLPALEGALGPAIATRIGGPLASGFQAVSLAWIKAHEPDRWSRIQRVMLPKDALIHALTGQHVTDPSDAVGTGMFDVAGAGWAWDVVDTIGIPHDWLPRVIPSGSEVGAVLPGIAQYLGLRPGIPVIIAGGDAPVGAVGGSVTQPDQALIMLSSGAQIILPSMTFTPDPAGRWYTWPAALPSETNQARFLRVGTLLNAGIATSWLRNILADPDAIALEPSGLIALPHLIGERTPLRDPDARGAILGVTPETTQADLSRAMLEGIAYSLRHALEVMSVEGPRPDVIHLGGGGSQSAILQAIITSVLGIPTERTATPELSAYGAALLAANGDARTIGPCGRFPWPPIASPDELSTRDASRTHPDPALISHYNARYAIYRDALDAMTPISHRLAKHRELS
jgi:xylulokinase